MDACSTQEHHFTKDSPSSKLLFANEIDKYKLLVQRFYADIQAMPIINDRDMGMLLTEESREHAQELVYFSALNELYAYANQNKEMVIDELNQNEFALQQQLAEKFQKMLDTMEQPPDVLATISNSSLENFDKQQQRSMSGQRGQVLPHPHHYERRIY
jgi:plexin A